MIEDYLRAEKEKLLKSEGFVDIKKELRKYKGGISVWVSGFACTDYEYYSDISLADLQAAIDKAKIDFKSNGATDLLHGKYTGKVLSVIHESIKRYQME